MSDAIGAAEGLARAFHETYERLAPQYGYETRADTKSFDPSTPNGQLMTAVCAVLIRRAAITAYEAAKGGGVKPLEPAARQIIHELAADIRDRLSREEGSATWRNAQRIVELSRPAALTSLTSLTSPASGTEAWHDVDYLMSIIDAAIEDGFDPDEDGPVLDEIRANLKAGRSPSPASGERDAPAGYVLVPVEPTEEMLRAGMDDLGWWVEPYEAPRESGVPIDSDMSAEDAAVINAQQIEAIASCYRAMLAAALRTEGE